MVHSGAKRAALATCILVLLVIIAIGTLALLMTSSVEIKFDQDPNSVEAHEAARKLALFNEAQAARRKGFVRFSEVEINSYLDGRFNTDSRDGTNSPPFPVKSCVLLSPSEFTFVTWNTTEILGFSLPFVWQRTVAPNRDETNGWTFATREMRVGKVEIPEMFWPQIDQFFFKSDRCFHGREDWLSRLPAITLTRNELSQSPELRLYTYLPEL